MRTTRRSTPLRIGSTPRTCASFTAIPCRRSMRSTPRTGSACRRFGTRGRASRGSSISASFPTPSPHATAERSAELDTRHNFTVIHNGLDRRRITAAAAGLDRNRMRESLGASASEIVVLLLGTVCERKGQLDLAHALSTLTDASASRVRVLFVGDRPSVYSRALHAAIDALALQRRSRVTIVPETEDVARYLVAADVFACTSRVESYPRVILEAMAYGLPIVTTPVFGIREQVREGVNGVFYEPGDEIGRA